MTRDIIFEWGVPRVIQGYWDLGSIQIPPLPVQIVLEDRGIPGQLWLLKYVLQFDQFGNQLPGHISISDQIPQKIIDRKGTLAPNPDVQVYAANEGPIVGYDPAGGTQIRLFVRTTFDGNGNSLGPRLGIESDPRCSSRPSGHRERSAALHPRAGPHQSGVHHQVARRHHHELPRSTARLHRPADTPMMFTKTTPAGAPVDDMDQLGDPFAPKGERLHDRPRMQDVQSDLAAMDRRFDQMSERMNLDGHSGDVSRDVRQQYENQFRNQLVVGAYDSPEAMFADGAPMPMTVEDAVRYSGGETREAISQQSAYTDGLLDEYLRRYPEMANDDALNAAVENTMRELREYYREDPAQFARTNRKEFLDRVYYRHLSETQHSMYDDSSRTAGISAGGPARGTQQAPQKDMIEELHALQKAKGIY